MSKPHKPFCSSCDGDGHFLDTTYDRTGVNVECGPCYGTGLSRDDLHKAIKRGLSAPGWRSIKNDPPPDDGTQVLMWSPDLGAAVWPAFKRWDYVTAWQPLPEPPEDNA